MCRSVGRKAGGVTVGEILYLRIGMHDFEMKHLT